MKTTGDALRITVKCALVSLQGQIKFIHSTYGNDNEDSLALAFKENNEKIPYLEYGKTEKNEQHG